MNLQKEHLLETTKNNGSVDFSRRAFLLGGASFAAGLLLFGCRSTTTDQINSVNRNIGIDGRDYTIAPPQGTAREISLDARISEIEIAPNRVVQAWTYDGKLPGTELRARQGERLRVSVTNNLPQETSIHWHGIPQRGTNKMDGVPGVTQQPIQPGGVFVYDFAATEAGSYMFHSHSGLQLERGLYAPLIVEPLRETLQYDREYVLTIDDWLEGSPGDAYEKLRRGEMQNGSSMSGMGKMDKQLPGANTEEDALGDGKQGANSNVAQMEEGADVAYQTFLINGRAPEMPAEFAVKRGERIRLRFINPSGSTMYRVAIQGHKMTVTHADGFAVKPVEMDALEISMGERYDVILTANNPGVWAIAAMSTDEPERGARALLKYSDARGTPAPPLNIKPKELSGRLLNYNQLVAADELPPLQKREPDRRIELKLGGQMLPYEWKINNQLYPNAEPLEIRAGEIVRVSMINESQMRHPMHLHGHSFRLLTGDTSGAPPLKDTAFIESGGGKLDFEFLADNPGDWLFHCHHAYHMEAGMARVVKYI